MVKRLPDYGRRYHPAPIVDRMALPFVPSSWPSRLPL